jgi:ABC-type transporter Mla maintaining outer membrane lipid asymmetry ATPase subunit MlaF
MTRPKVLVLDEPLSALDPFLRGHLRGELKRLQRGAVNVEYFGATVRVSMTVEIGSDASALIPDQLFFAAPVDIGQPTFVWSERDAHLLSE